MSKNQSCSESVQIHFYIEVSEFSNAIFVFYLHTLRLTERSTKIVTNCQFTYLIRFCYRPPTKLREGNVFTPVCLSTGEGLCSVGLSVKGMGLSVKRGSLVKDKSQ